MLRRALVGAAIVVWSVSSFAISVAHAQTLNEVARRSAPLFLSSESSVPAPQPVAADPQPAAVVAAVVPDASVAMPETRNGSVRTAKRSNILLPFYASTAVVQALDVHSTLQVLRQGGGEGNPMLQGLVQHEGAFIAAKAAIAASTMYAASRIAKRNKIGAIVVLVGINSAYAVVAAHNYQLAHQMR